MSTKDFLLKKGTIITSNGTTHSDLLIIDGIIHNTSDYTPNSDTQIIDCTDKFISPALVDVHVHFRQPGFEYKETIITGAAAASNGGYSTVCTMPNLNPPPDCVENINIQINAIKQQSNINILPYASITKGQKGSGKLVNFEALAPLCFAFSDDGKGVQSTELMRDAMLRAKAVNKHIVAHCEDESLLSHGGCIHDGEYAKQHGFIGINSESEWKQVERDINLVRETNCKYHICHISTKETVELVRQAKAEGLPVTCETAPHYLILCDKDLQDDGRFKMNPPLRSSDDREALIQGIIDGTIDMIATDHAPHSSEEKSKGLKDSAFGIVGLETAFPILYTHLVKTNIISLERLIQLMSLNPRKTFNIAGGIDIGQTADLAIWDIETPYTITPSSFHSMGKASLFDGYEVWGKCEQIICNNKQTIL